MVMFRGRRTATMAPISLFDTDDPPPATAAGGPGIDYVRGIGQVSRSTASMPGTMSGDQRQMVRYSKTNGLARFAVAIVADTGSRVKLFPERLNTRNGEWEQFDDELCHAILARFRGRYTDAQQTLWYHLWHRRATGERYQVYEVDPMTGEAYFSVYGIMAVTVEGDRFRIIDREGGQYRYVPAGQVVRMWWPDPDYPQQAWTPLFAGIEDLKRYHLLGRVISRTAASSLLSRGIMWVPREGLGPKVMPQDRPRLLVDYYNAARDRLSAEDDSVAATVPFVMHYGNDFQAPKLISFDMPFDNQILSLRSEALESFARAADLPSSIVINGGPGRGQASAGSQGFNHITDLLVDRRYFDHTVAPQVEAVLHEDLTRWFLRPALNAAVQRGAFQVDPMMVRVGYDPSPVIVPADKSRNALEAFRTGLLKVDSALKALGFAPADAPSPAELRQILELIVATHQGQGLYQGDRNQVPGTPQRNVVDAGTGTAVATNAP